MSIVTLYLPSMGESILEAVVLHWLVREGSPVSEGDALLEVATDKVDAEVPALCTGVVKKWLVQPGAVVAVGAPIALLEVTGEVETAAASHVPHAPTAKVLAAAPRASIPVQTEPLGSAPEPRKRTWSASPLVKQLAREHNVPLEELDHLVGHAKDNRITKAVFLAYLERRPVSPPSRQLFAEPLPPPLEGDVCVRMDRVRKIIAERMVQSKAIAPHVTSFARADVTELVAWRNQHKAAFEQKIGLKLTYLPIFMRAIARSLRAFPLLNAVVAGDTIRQRKQINLGFAVALPDGNLIVPVIKQVDGCSFVALAKKLDDLIRRARKGTLRADELTEGTYTVSNLGSFGNLMGTPIIVQPQIAILGLGIIERRPAVVARETGERIEIRDEMFLSHTYDHRIVDGAVGGGFLSHLAKELMEVVKNNLVDF